MDRTKLRNIEDRLRAFKGEQSRKDTPGVRTIEVDTVSGPLKVETTADLLSETVAGAFQACQLI